MQVINRLEGMDQQDLHYSTKAEQAELLQKVSVGKFQFPYQDARLHLPFSIEFSYYVTSKLILNMLIWLRP